MCKHSEVSLVEMDSKLGPFLTVQCDVCGDCLPQAPIDDATYDAWYERRLQVPRMDYAAYCRATDAAWRDVVLGDAAGLDTFAKVAKAER